MYFQRLKSQWHKFDGHLLKAQFSRHHFAIPGIVFDVSAGLHLLGCMIGGLVVVDVVVVVVDVVVGFSVVSDPVSTSFRGVGLWGKRIASLFGAIVSCMVQIVS